MNLDSFKDWLTINLAQKAKILAIFLLDPHHLIDIIRIVLVAVIEQLCDWLAAGGTEGSLHRPVMGKVR